MDLPITLLSILAELISAVFNVVVWFLAAIDIVHTQAREIFIVAALLGVICLVGLGFSLKKKKSLDLVFLVPFFVLIALLTPIVTPGVFDLLFGNMVVNTHLNQVVQGEKNVDAISSSLHAWANETALPYNDPRLYSCGLLCNAYNFNNKTKWFFGGAVKSSWFIENHIGNCRELALYYMEMMDRLGYNRTMVCEMGGDHCIDEYTDNSGAMMTYDVYTNDTKTPRDFQRDRCGAIMKTIDLNGHETDVSDYYFDRGVVSINVKDNTLNAFIHVSIKSNCAMVKYGPSYKDPNEVISVPASDTQVKIRPSEYLTAELESNNPLFVEVTGSEKPIVWNDKNESYVELGYDENIKVNWAGILITLIIVGAFFFALFVFAKKLLRLRKGNAS